MTPKEEVLKMLTDIEKDVIRVYEGQIHGEEMFPYVMAIQERLYRTKNYINGKPLTREKTENE